MWLSKPVAPITADVTGHNYCHFVATLTRGLLRATLHGDGANVKHDSNTAHKKKAPILIESHPLCTALVHKDVQRKLHAHFSRPL